MKFRVEEDAWELFTELHIEPFIVLEDDESKSLKKGVLIYKDD